MKTTVRFIAVFAILFVITMIPHALVRIHLTNNGDLFGIVAAHIRLWIPIGLCALASYLFQRA